MMQKVKKKKGFWMNQTPPTVVISTSSVYGVEPFKHAKQALLRSSALGRLPVFSLTEKKGYGSAGGSKGLLDGITWTTDFKLRKQSSMCR